MKQKKIISHSILATLLSMYGAAALAQGPGKSGSASASCQSCATVLQSAGGIPTGTYCILSNEGGSLLLKDPNGGVGKISADKVRVGSCNGSATKPGTHHNEDPLPTDPIDVDTHPTNPIDDGTDIESIGKKHFMIQASNFSSLSATSKQYPIFVYGFATDPALKSTGGDIQRFIGEVNVNGAYAKMLIFSSAASAEKYLGNASVKSQLKNAGIQWIGYNQEGDKTPASEFNDPYNAVVRFAQITKQHGFKFIWGPLRHMLDGRADNGTIKRMCQAGLNGIAIQEQNQVSGDGSNRIAAVLATINKYRAQCGGNLYVTVQTLWGQGGNCSNGCSALVRGIQQQANSISLWANRDKASEINSVLSQISFFVK